MAVHWWLLRAVQSLEDHIVASILRQPGFHRAVGRIHKTIHEKQHGRNPNEPLAPGEATGPTTADPNSANRNERFAKHFLDEIKNQFRGKPTDFPGDKTRK
ncbi:unnamed protein product [Fusarium venenatum]|uniref:Uncharacterized protein n=1 Tax=Fusarium venenatum TaxID=56646 RepID=A0A2L2TYZ6_9HYPO|nr:uncharacterized protein FVRRES_10363 [Fusarium venenatum]CEI70286.1 unnamed protein product [Fusarium venenatum]